MKFTRHYVCTMNIYNCENKCCAFSEWPPNNRIMSRHFVFGQNLKKKKKKKKKKHFPKGFFNEIWLKVEEHK